MKKLFLLKWGTAILSALLFTALALGWVYARGPSPSLAHDTNSTATSAPGLLSAPVTDFAAGESSVAIPNAVATTLNFTITVQACLDGNRNGCEPGELPIPPPLGVNACLEGPGLPANHCQPITSPAGFVFTNLVTGAYTASLRLDPALVAQKYELTSPLMVTVTLTGCQCDIVCTSPACESKCHCNCEATVKLGIIQEGVKFAKADQPDPVIAGGILTYTLTATNTGMTNVTDIVISDTLDSQVSFRSAGPSCTHDGQPTDGTVTCPVGILPPGATVTHTLSVIVGNNLIPPCVITNTASVIFKDGSGATAMTTTTITTTVKPGITVNACEDQDADGDCGPSATPPLSLAGVQACLTNGSAPPVCMQVPAVFTQSLIPGVYTATLQFTGPSQGYYPTLPFTTTTLTSLCGSSSITLPLVNPVHPKGVAVHEGSNKVYVAFQGPVVFSGTITFPNPFVAVIDGATDSVLQTIPGGAGGLHDGRPAIGREPWGVAVSGNYVYVGSFRDRLVSVINTGNDTVVDNVTDSEVKAKNPGPNKPNDQIFMPTAPYVNPANGQVHFPDYFGGRVIILSGAGNIEQVLNVAEMRNARFKVFSPFEITIDTTGYNFLTLRDAIETPSEFRGFPSSGSPITQIDILPPSPPNKPSGSPHAIGLWTNHPSGNSRLYITYADDPSAFPGDQPFKNPNKLLVYQYPLGNPTAVTMVTQTNLSATLGINYAEAGLIYNQQANHMLGTYGGFAYAVGNVEGMQIDEKTACNKPEPGGTYALDFNGNVLGSANGADTDKVWKLPQKVVGNPPLQLAGQEYKNPFEIALNPNNGKIYVTDRCWNEFPGGGIPGSGAVLIFSDDIVTTAAVETLLSEPISTTEPLTQPTAIATTAPPTDTPSTVPTPPESIPPSEPTPAPPVEPTPEPTPTTAPTEPPPVEAPPEPTPTTEAITEPPVEPTNQPTSEPTTELVTPPEETTAIVSGQVLLAGRTSSVTIAVDDSGQSAATDASGLFSIADVATGEHTAITVDAPGYLPAVCAAPTIAAPETRLAIVTLLSGDMNNDNQVDIFDLTAAANSFGQSGSGLPADTNGDGQVNIFDLALTAANFGQGVQVWNCRSE